jgi:hypothetical protein
MNKIFYSKVPDVPYVTDVPYVPELPQLPRGVPPPAIGLRRAAPGSNRPALLSRFDSKN